MLEILFTVFVFWQKLILHLLLKTQVPIVKCKGPEIWKIPLAIE